LVLFFRKEQDSSFSEEKEAKRLWFPGAGSKIPDLAGKVILCQAVDGQGGGDQLPSFLNP
jgi:hypothetical protein